jgi:hypothetical protein
MLTPRASICSVLIHKEHETEMAKTIPADVLTKIIEHRPHLKTMASHGEHAHLARNYLTGESRLTGFETYRLAAIAAGQDW